MTDLATGMASAGNPAVSPRAWLVSLAILAVLCCVLAVAVGPNGLVSPLALTASGSHPDVFLLRTIRLPRALAAALCGATLAVSGAAMQALFRNPLADPGLTGVTPGATLGVIAALIGGGLFPAIAPVLKHPLAAVISAFAGGAAVSGLLLAISNRFGRGDMASLLLAGIAISALAGALTGLAIAAANDAELRDFTFWSLGSLAGTESVRLAWAAPVMLVAVTGLSCSGTSLNRLSLGDAQAFHLGESVRASRRRILAMAAAGTGAAVALTGGVAFVGIIVPHLMRLLVGVDHRTLLPASALAGASLLVVCDIIARVAVTPAELPLGILTALSGAPIFLWLLFRTSR